jgi:hypothetical protein
MNWNAIGALSESVGAVAVVVTLLYLAIQIRAQTKESRLTATRDLSRDYLDAVEAISRDKEVFSLYLKALAEYEDLPHDERIRISMIFFRIFRVTELRYSHYLSQDVDAAHFENGQLPIKDLMNSPGLRAWWGHNGDVFSEEFRAHIDRFSSDGENKTIG